MHAPNTQRRAKGLTTGTGVSAQVLMREAGGDLSFIDLRRGGAEQVSSYSPRLLLLLLLLLLL